MFNRPDTKIAWEVSRLEAELDERVFRMLTKLDDGASMPDVIASDQKDAHTNIRRARPSTRNVIQAQIRVADMRVKVEAMRRNQSSNEAAGSKERQAKIASLAADCAIVQRFVDRNITRGLSPLEAFQAAFEDLQTICQFEWSAFEFDAEKKRVLVRADAPTSTSTNRDRTPSEDDDVTR